MLHVDRDGDVFIQVGPVNPRSGPNEAPVTPLLGGRIAQARKPLQRDAQRAPVLEIDDESVGDELQSASASLRSGAPVSTIASRTTS